MNFLNEKAMHSLFEEQVARTPGNIAIVQANGEPMTYAQLNQKSNRLARKLLADGLKRNQVVALKMNLSPELIIAILGLWKAGGVYLPLDTSLPADRINYLIQDAVPHCILTEIDDEMLEGYSAANLEEKITGQDLACHMYTSGSTGLPTGVLIEHRAVLTGIIWCKNYFQYGIDDVFLLKTSISFVDSLREIFSPLISGGRIAVSQKEEVKEIKKIVSAIEIGKVSYIGFVPSMLAIFLSYLRENKAFSKVASLKTVIVSGEPLNLKIVQDFNETLYKANGTTLYNTYGLTEANDLTFQNCSEEEALSVSIGMPIDNVRIYVLDEELNAVPVGEPGNIWVAGCALARGYHKNQELTNRKFRALPGLEERALNTGDMARWLADGRLQHLGRKDRQVKISGNRVELGEIEYHLLKLEGIVKAVVISTSQISSYKKTDTSLAAYYVVDKPLSAREIRNYLSSGLPNYMVPNYFVKMKELPLTPTGKVDIKALPAPNQVYESDRKILLTPPKNEIEEKILSIWRELLGYKSIGTDEDFIELGGHSLLAIMMNLRLEREFKVEISLFDLFQAMTIEKQAKLIEKEKKRTAVPKEKNIALLNPKKEKHLFCFPPVGGYGLYFLPFAREMSFYSIYGLNFIEHENRLQEYTSHFVKRQPLGPYFLLGYSAGGNLAFELAKDMERLGLEIGGLILVDSIKKDRVINRSDIERNEAIARLFKDIILKDYKQFIPNEEILQGVRGKAMANLLFMDQLVNEGEISADIHLVKAGTADSCDYLSYLQEGVSPQGTDSWKTSTRGNFYQYQGYGSHFDMMQGDNVLGNARVIESILNHIIRPTGNN